MLISLILVLGSGLAHATWNLFAKQSTDKALFLWAIYAPTTIALIPILVFELLQASYHPMQWAMLGASLLMQAIYSALLSYTYKAGDLSQVYPVMRGTPTLLTPLVGVLLLGESISHWSWLGIGFMLIGFMIMLSPFAALSKRASLTPILLALAVGLCITTYTIIDKVNLQYISPLSLLEVTNIGFMLGLMPAAIKRGRLIAAIKQHKRIIGIGAILSPGSYLLFLFAASQSNISSVAPLREVGIVFGTIFGLIILKESQGTRRIIASAAIVVGIVAIASVA